MKFIADKNIPLAAEAFGKFGEVELVQTGRIANDLVQGADVLIVRSETKVNEALLRGSRVRFVGTATIGTDHIDTEYLKSEGIAFASAPGCNSNSVKEYLVGALLELSVSRNFSLEGKSIGVVGVGNVGRKVVAAAKSLGLTVLENDPPRARAEGGSGFVSLDEILSADIITLHVPLTKGGTDPTYHLFNKEKFSRFQTGKIFINTSRGGVVETSSLKHAIAGRSITASVLDVWENEPDIDSGLLSLVTIGSPHIAGYSLEGKVNGTKMIHDAFCAHFNFADEWDPFDLIEKPAVAEINMRSDPADGEELLNKIVKTVYDIKADDSLIRNILKTPDGDRGDYFRRLRSGYRIRREFSNFKVLLPGAGQALSEKIRNLGFR